MSFMQKLRMAMSRFMMGRNGSDELSRVCVLASLVLMLLSAITGISILYTISLVGYVYGLFRMFSKNVAKRTSENMKWVSFREKFTRSISQTFTRLKNSRKYKYFRCPECNSLLRLPRKVGNVTVTCGKCKHKFDMKA